MITGDPGFQQTCEQLSRACHALAALRAEVLPKGEAWFSLLAEGPLDQIRQLQHELEEYAGVTAALEAQAELWLKIEGRSVEEGNSPASILTALLDALRKGVQAVAEYLATGQLTARPTIALKRACDPCVIALKPGSLQVGIRFPTEQPDRLFDPRHVKQAIHEYLEVLSWAGSAADVEALTRQVGDADKRRVLLNAVKPFLPRPRGDVDSVTVFGRLVPKQQSIRLSKKGTERIDRAIDQTTREQKETVVGDLREIDLDRLMLTLRNEKEVWEIRCTFGEELLETAKEALDRTVQATGFRRIEGGRRSHPTLRLVRLEILDDASTGEGNGPGA